MAAIDLISKALWFRAKDLSTGSVTSWPDQSGNARNATCSAMTVATASTPNGGKSVTGSVMAASVTTLGMIDGTYVHVTGPATTAFVPAHLTDGDASTLWSAPAGGSLPITITYRIRTAADATTFTTATITEYTIRNGGTAANSPTAWTFQGSNDGSSWTTLDTVTGATTTANTSTAHSFSNSTAYEYYKWVITAVNGGSQAEWLMATLTGISTGKTQQDGELWVVIKRDTANSTAWRLGTSGSSSHYDFSGTVYDDTGSTSRWSFTPGVAITSWRTYRVRVQGTNWTAYLDGTSQTTTSSSTKSWQTSAPAVLVGQSGWVAEWILFDHALDTTEVTTVTDYLNAEHFITGTGASLSGTGSITTAGVVDRSTGATLSGTGSVTAAGSTTADFNGTSSRSGTGSITAAGTVARSSGATLSGTGIIVASQTTPPQEVPIVTGYAVDVASFESAPVDSEILVVEITTGYNVAPRALLAPTAPSLGVLTEWPIERQAHIMPALSAANPRYRPEIDYDIDYGEVGRLHVWVDGQDVTYLRGIPARFADFTSSVPFGPASASIALPQLTPWDEPGTGDLAVFDMSRDPLVEIALVRPDDSVEPKWEGFLAADEDSSGEGREEYTFHAEGLLAQAMHEPYDPPVYMPPTDPLHIVADVLNSVTHRMWGDIPRVDSDLPKVTDRGSPGQSKWQRVQDLLSKAITTDGRQWTLKRVAAFTYRIVLKDETDTATWTVTKGAPGIECSFVTDQATRRDAIFGRGFAPDGGYWEGRVFPGLEFGVPPPYPLDPSDNIDVGTTDADTTSGNGVTTWQRQMRDIGYPVTVDGVMNSNDTYWVTKIQRDRGLTVDGSLGPQTFAATWENNSTDADLTTYRLPLAWKPEVEPNLYSASGAITGPNPADDPSVIRHAMPEIDFGSGIKKSDAIKLARLILDRESDPGIQVRIVMTTDQHEDGASRFDIVEGDNVHIVGHRGGTTVQVSEVSVNDLSVTLTGDTKARDALAVQAILERNEDARRNPSGRTGTRDVSSLNKSSVVQFESESKAGFVPRTAVNGDSGLWTIRKTFVSQVGVAKVEFTATGPNSELVVGLFNRPIRTSVLASMAPDPLSDSDGWYDNVETLQESYGLMEVFGTPGNPGGYWPRQKGDGPLTGKLRDSSSSLYDSPYGGFVWVAMFTSQSCWVEGRVFPAVPT